MTILETPPSLALDESAHEFISTFMEHVTTLTGYNKTRLTTIAGIKTLLLAALAHPDDASSTAWRGLYRSIDALVDAALYAHDTRTAHAYLRSFVQENGDLAHD